MIEISVLSREYLKVDVVPRPGSSLANAEVEFAFKPFGEDPETEDWHEGELYEENGFWRARVLVGPGHQDSAFTFTPSEWQVWCAITLQSSPERPVRRTGVVNAQ